MEFLSHVYKQNQSHQQTLPIFEEFDAILIKYLNIFFSIYALAIVGCIYGLLCICLFKYVVYDERALIFPLLIPGVSLDIDGQYELTLLLQVYVGQFGSLLMMYFDAIFVFELLHVILMANIVCNGIRAVEPQPDALAIVSNMRSIIQGQNKLRE